MADPSSGSGGYECHGPMTAITQCVIFEGVEDPYTRETVAFLCEECGVWRDALRIGDPKRAEVAVMMAAVLRNMGLTK